MEPDEKKGVTGGMVTEVEARKRERAAWRNCATAALLKMTRFGVDGSNIGSTHEYLDEERERIYPAPQVEIPRVEQDPHLPAAVEWSVRDGAMMGRDLGLLGESGRHSWTIAPQATNGWLTVSAERVALWADLLANPTRLVDADSAEASHA